MAEQYKITKTRQVYRGTVGSFFREENFMGKSQDSKKEGKKKPAKSMKEKKAEKKSKKEARG
jgi:hypothetical protein